MKKNTFLIIATLVIFNFGLQSAAAQFDLKIPKIKKPKVEQPKTDEPKTEQPKTNDNGNQNTPKKSGGDVGIYGETQTDECSGFAQTDD